MTCGSGTSLTSKSLDFDALENSDEVNDCGVCSSDDGLQEVRAESTSSHNINPTTKLFLVWVRPEKLPLDDTF